ncbi:MAG TPA: AMP-binding protein [Polyangiaceae bacterium]|nr:AMP-binding protein [Polyangiaceae bacterium]
MRVFRPGLGRHVREQCIGHVLRLPKRRHTHAARGQLSSLELLQVGGAKLPVELARRVKAGLGCELQQVYGMAEGLVCYTRSADSEETVLTTQGRPMCPDDELRVVDAMGNDVETGAVGELWTRGPYTIRGYYLADDANRQAFSSAGFYRTGVLVRLTKTGHVVVEGALRGHPVDGASSVRLRISPARKSRIDHRAVARRSGRATGRKRRGTDRTP